MELLIPDTFNMELLSVSDKAKGSYNELNVGVKGVSTKIETWTDLEGNIAFEAPLFFGDSVYGFNTKTLVDDLRNSDVVETLTGFTFDELKEQLFESFKPAEGDGDSASSAVDPEKLFNINSWKEAMSLYTSSELYVDMYETLTPSVIEETLTVNGNEIPVIAIRYTISAIKQQKFADELTSRFCEILGISPDLVEPAGTPNIKQTERYYLNKATGELVSYSTVSGKNGINVIINDPETVDITFEVKLDSADFEGIFESGDIGAENFAPGDFGIGDSGIRPLSAESGMTAHTDEPGTTTCPPDPSITTAATEYSEEPEERPENEIITITCTLKEVTDNGKDGFKFDVVMASSAEEGTVNAGVSFTRNIEDGKFDLKMTANVPGEAPEELILTGILTYTETEFNFSMDQITIDGNSQKFTFKLSAKAEGTVEDVPEYKNLAKLNYEEIGKIAGIIGEMFGIEGDAGSDSPSSASISDKHL